MSGDLSVTALYTSQVWAWGGLTDADLLSSPDGKRVFDVTNAALGLARLARPDLAPLRYALLHRHVMIDHLLGDTAGSVVELAAGLSRRGAANCASRNYIEVDLPAVILKKRELFARTARGREVLERLTLQAGDVTKDDFPAADTIIAEGLFMYLDGEARRNLFAKIASHAQRLIFDLVPSSEEPVPGRVGALLERAMKKFTGGRSFERDARTREQLVDELHAAGFPDVAVHASADVARTWNLPHPERATTMVVFSAARGTRA